MGLFTRLVLATLPFTALAAAVPSDSCVNGTQVYGSRSCTIECGVDHAGGDYKAIQTSNSANCFSACGADATCQTAQYNTGNGYCYMKNAVNPPSSNPSVYSVNCGTAPAPPPVCTVGTQVINGRTCVTQCATDRPGGDYRQMQMKSFQDCAAACSSDSQCIGAQYNVNGYCYMKNSNKDATSNSATTSVTCDVAQVSMGIASGVIYRWYYYGANEPVASNTDFNTDLFQANHLQSPTYQGVLPDPNFETTNWPSAAGTFTLPDQSSVGSINTNLAAAVLQGYFVAPATGVYKFYSDGYDSDNYNFLWVNSAAYQWTHSNVAYKSIRDSSGHGTPGQQMLTLKSGDAIPMTFFWANDDIHQAQSQFLVTLPDGSTHTVGPYLQQPASGSGNLFL